jgi:hypothetical protein
MKALALLCFLCVACSLAPAQLKIENPNRLEVPEQKAQLLWNMARRVAAEEFHVNDDTEIPLTLVPGEETEHYNVKEDGTYSIYLRNWDDVKFTVLATRLALLRLAGGKRGIKMTREFLRRAERSAPVSARTPQRALDSSSQQ